MNRYIEVRYTYVGTQTDGDLSRKRARELKGNALTDLVREREREAIKSS